MLIVQISDIHCGPMFNQETFRTAIKEINAMSPDAVLPEQKLKKILKEEWVNKRYSYKLI